jgi:hypothetical protein
MDSKDGALRWLDGEREAFRGELFPDDMRYYVEDDVIARYRDDPSAVTEEAWEALFARGGYHVNVGVAFAPAAHALAALEARSAAAPDTYWPMKGALAVLGDALIPLAVRLVKLAVSNIGNGVYSQQINRALVDMAPLEAPELVEPILGVLSSKANGKAKASAKAWLVRHRAVSAPVIAAALADPQSPLRAAAKVAKKAFAEADAGAGTARKEGGLERIGWLYYRSHHATPLVVGDLAVMHDWRGAPDGADEAALVPLPKGSVALFEMHLRAPEVLRAPGGEVILLADEKLSSRLGDEIDDEELIGDALAPLVKTFETLTLTVESGALVLAVAYNATPAEGASVEGLDEACFAEGETPRLPLRAPAAPIHLEELVVVPVPNGRYELRNGRTDKRLKCVVTRA